MSKFFFLLWLKWAVRLTTCSILFAAVFSFFVTIFIYFFQGMANLNDEVRSALFDIFKFWFMIFWALSLILAHFRGLKYIFNRCINGYELRKELNNKGIFICTGSLSGLAEEAPQAYKNIDDVVDVVDSVGIAKKIAKFVPLAVVKG